MKLLDVASRAGVSRALVSIVIRGPPGASAESRQRVLQAADEPRAVRSLLQDRCEALILLGPQAPTSDLGDLTARLPVVVVTRSVRHRAPGAADRRRGYRQAMRLHGLHAEARILPGGLTEDDGAAAHAPLDLPAGLTTLAVSRAIDRLNRTPVDHRELVVPPHLVVRGTAAARPGW